MKVAKVNFGESIGSGECFWGTTLSEIRYIVEGYAAFDSSAEPQYPETVELHFWKCYGGEVYEGYAIYNYLRGLAAKGIRVVAYNHGLIASIAVLIYLAADERQADHASQGFTHKPSCDLGAFANADEMRKAAAELDKIQQQIADVYAVRGGMSPELAHQFLNSNAWQTADELVTNGFATAKTTDVLVAPAGAEKVINYFKPTPTPQNMAITPAEKKSIVDDVINGIKDFFKPRNEAEPAPAAEPAAPVNLAVTLAGDAGTVYVDTAGDAIAQGDMVYSDEAMTTAAADGDYSLADGRTIAVAAGAITSITEAAADTAEPANSAEPQTAEVVEQLRAENAVLKNQLTLAQNKLKAVPGSTGNPTPPGATNSTPGKAAVGGGTDAESPADRAAKAVSNAFNSNKRK